MNIPPPPPTLIELATPLATEAAESAASVTQVEQGQYGRKGLPPRNALRNTHVVDMSLNSGLCL